MILLNAKEKCLVCSISGEISRPSCIDDLINYHAYLIGSDNKESAQQVLNDVWAGEKVITKMVEHFHKDINDVYNYRY